MVIVFNDTILFINVLIIGTGLSSSMPECSFVETSSDQTLPSDGDEATGRGPKPLLHLFSICAPQEETTIVFEDQFGVKIQRGRVGTVAAMKVALWMMFACCRILKMITAKGKVCFFYNTKLSQFNFLRLNPFVQSCLPLQGR